MMVDHSSVSQARLRLLSRQTIPPSAVGPTAPVIALVGTSGSGGVPGPPGASGSGFVGPPGSPGAAGSGSVVTGSEPPPPPHAASPRATAAATATWVAFFLIGFTLLCETAEWATTRFLGGLPVRLAALSGFLERVPLIRQNAPFVTREAGRNSGWRPILRETP